MKTRGEEIADEYFSHGFIGVLIQKIDTAIHNAYIKGVQCGHIVSKHGFRDCLNHLLEDGKITDEAYKLLIEYTIERAF